jgi:hypothetical protein
MPWRCTLCTGRYAPVGFLRFGLHKTQKRLAAGGPAFCLSILQIKNRSGTVLPLLLCTGGCAQPQAQLQLRPPANKTSAARCQERWERGGSIKCRQHGVRVMLKGSHWCHQTHSRAREPWQQHNSPWFPTRRQCGPWGCTACPAKTVGVLPSKLKDKPPISMGLAHHQHDGVCEDRERMLPPPLKNPRVSYRTALGIRREPSVGRPP